MNIFVGNLSFEAVEADLKKLFEGFGSVASVAIVMRKEKKEPKSRGFGFVQMPDEQQALAALAALNGREFMGRVLDISPARPKTEAQPLSKPLAFKDGRTRPPAQHLALLDGKCAPSGQPGTYNGGRRTRSYMKRRELAGIHEEVKPRRKNYDNPMRWRKRGEQPRPWEKRPAEHKPLKKAEEGARPWIKSSSESNPRRPSVGRFKPWEKPVGESKPWKKSTGEPKPWKKPVAEAKPWSKNSAPPQKSRFKSRGKSDGYKR